MNNQSSLASIQFKGTANQSIFYDVDTRSCFSLRIGLAAGARSHGASNVFVGSYAGRFASPVGTIALGTYTGESTVGARLILIGNEAGRYASAADSVVIGEGAGMWLRGSETVLLGTRAGGAARFPGGKHVIAGAHAAEFGEGVGAGDTVVGHAAGRHAVATGGSNVLVGLQSAGRASNLAENVLIGYDVAASASNLARSVVIGPSAGTHAGGTDNVLVGADAASVVLSDGSHNVVIGASDTVAPATSASVAIGLACASADVSVSVGANVVTSRYFSTSIGNDIVSMSDNAVSIGGTINVNAVSVFSDPLNVYATPDPAAGNLSEIVYDAWRSGEAVTLAPGYVNVEDGNTSRRYRNAVRTVDSRLFVPDGRPFLLELGSTFLIDDDAKWGRPVQSAVGDLRATVFAARDAADEMVGLLYASITDQGAVTAVLGSSFAMEVSATFATAYGMAGVASSNVIGTADAFVRWTAYLPKRMRKPCMPAAALTFGSLTPFVAFQSLSCNAMWSPALAVDAGVGAASGLVDGGRTSVWITRAPTFGSLGAIGVLDAAAPSFSSYNYCLPLTRSDSFAVRAAHYPPGGEDRAVPADAEMDVRLVFLPKTVGFGSAFPLVAGGRATMGGPGCPVFYGTSEGALVVTPSDPLLVAETGRFGVGDWGYGLRGVRLAPGVSAAAASGLVLTFAFDGGAYIASVETHAYESDALPAAAAAAACNVVVTRVPTCGYVSTAASGGGALSLGSVDAGAWAAPFSYVCLDAISAPPAGETLSLVANVVGSSADASVQRDATFEAPPYVHASEVTVVTAFGGSRASVVSDRDGAAPAVVSFPASNVSVLTGAIRAVVVEPLAAPAATFSVASNVLVVDAVTAQQTGYRMAVIGVAGGCNVTTVTSEFVFGAFTSNLPTVSTIVARSDGVALTVTSNVRFATAAVYSSDLACPVAAYTWTLVANDVVDQYFAHSDGRLLYTSNYALARPPGALVGLADSSNFSRFDSNVVRVTSNAYAYDYVQLTPDHAYARPFAFAVVTSVPQSTRGAASVDFLHTSTGHGGSAPGFAFTAADVAAGRVFVRPMCAEPSGAGHARVRIAYANGASHGVSAYFAPSFEFASNVALSVGSNVATPMAPVAMDVGAVGAALPAGWSSDASARLCILPSLAPRPGFWCASPDPRVGLPDLTCSLAADAPPLFYHYGRATALVEEQAFSAVVGVGSDADGWRWTTPFALTVRAVVVRAASVLYNAGVSIGPQVLSADALRVPGAASYQVTSASPGVSLSPAAFTPAQLASGEVRVNVDAPVASSNLALTLNGGACVLTVVPYWRSAYPDGGDAFIEFHHDGFTTANVVDPRLLAFAEEATLANVALPASTATMLVVVPPQTGYLTFDGDAALMEVPMARLADLRYVAIGSGRNDAITVRFSHAPGACSARDVVVHLKHYVYTAPGVYAASNLPPTAEETPQYSAGYMADGMPPRALPPATSNVSGWYSRVALRSPNPPSRVRYDVDRADRVSLTSTALLNTFSFDATQASSLRLVLVTNPARGIVVLDDAFAPVRYLDWADVTSGRAFYQHDGSPASVDPDVVTVCLSTHDYDVDTSRRFVLQFFVSDQPTMATNATEIVYGDPSETAHTLTSTFLAATESPVFFHVTSSTGASNVPSTFSSDDLPTIVLTSNVASFDFVATRSRAASPVFTHPFYAAQLSQTHAFGFNLMSSCNVIFDTKRISSVTYDYGANDPGYAGRVVGASFAFRPVVDFDPLDPALAAVVAPLTAYNFSLRFGTSRFAEDIYGAPQLTSNAPCILTFTSRALVVRTQSGKRVETLPWGASPPALNAWNVLTFRNVDADASAAFVDLNGTTLQVATLPIDFSSVRVVEFVYDAAANAFDDIKGVYYVAGFPVDTLVLNPLTAIDVRSLALTVSMYGSEGGVASRLDSAHNVIVGQNILVNGINNIAIGRAFSSSGDGSVILGTQIGVAATASTNAVASSLFECIVIGNRMFAGTVMANVVAIGRNVMNDVDALGVSLTELNSFAAQYPIIIGNNVSAAMMAYQVNVGGSFLRGIDGRVYLGVSGEQVCVGLNAAAAAATPSVASLVVSGAVQNATGANQFLVRVSSAFPDATAVGWVAAVTSTTANLAVAPASIYAHDAVVGVVAAFPSSTTAALQASGVCPVWVCDYGGGSNLPVGALVCASPVPGCAAAQWSSTVTSATVGKLLQPCAPFEDPQKRAFGENVASLVVCLLRMG